MRQLGDVDLATFCLHQLAHLGAEKEQKLTALQCALVHSFLTNYDKVCHDFVILSSSCYLVMLK